MIPWLLVAELLRVQGKTMSVLVSERMVAFPCSGEINYHVSDVPAVLAVVKAHFAAQNPVIDTTDGLSLELPEWRMNIRASNAEPLLRLNIETNTNPTLVDTLVAKVELIIEVICRSSEQI